HVEATLAPRAPLEVLDRVRQVGVVDLDPGADEGFAQEAAGGTDEGLALDVLAVAGGLADQHQPRLRRALAEDGLGRVAVEIAAMAVLDRLAQRLQRAALRQVGGRAPL